MNLEITPQVHGVGFLLLNLPAPRAKPTPTTINWIRVPNAVPAPVTAAGGPSRRARNGIRNKISTAKTIVPAAKAHHAQTSPLR